MVGTCTVEWMLCRPRSIWSKGTEIDRDPVLPVFPSRQRIVNQACGSSGPGLESKEGRGRAEETSGFWAPCAASFILSSVRDAASLSSVGLLILHAGLAGDARPRFILLPEGLAETRRASQGRRAWVPVWVHRVGGPSSQSDSWLAEQTQPPSFIR